MANLALSWSNHLPGGTLATNSEVMTLPLAHIRDPLGASLWRTQSAGGVYVTADLGSTRPIRVLALGDGVVSAAASWRLRLSSSAAHSGDLHDSGWVTMDPALVAGKRAQGALLLPAGIAARYARIDLDDPGRAGEGYLDIGHLWLADLWQPARNFSYGLESVLFDESRVTTSIGGQDYVDVREKIRTLRFVLRFLSESDVTEAASALDAAAGTSGNVLFMPDPNSANRNRQMLIGRLTEIGPVALTSHGIWSRAFEIRERL